MNSAVPLPVIPDGPASAFTLGVIPGRRERGEPGIHNPCISIVSKTGVMDSGTRYARPE